MKINSELGYEPVTYSELTQDEEFWAGCKSCVNYDILMAKGRKNCMCTAMLFDPAEKAKEVEEKSKEMVRKANLFSRIEKVLKSFSQDFRQVKGERLKAKGFVLGIIKK